MDIRKTFDRDGIALSYIDTGAGTGLPVVLLHGFASNTEMNWLSTGWVDFLSQLGRRVISLDHRGHGQSAKLYGLEDYGAPIMADDVRGLLDHLAIDQAHIMGYSMGARIAAFLAVNAPERVASLVFGGLGINMVRGMAGTGPIAHALEAESIDDVSNPTARTFRAFAEQTKSDLKALAACIRSARAPLTRDMVASIRSPVLVAVGDRDVIGGSPQELAELIPNARAFTINGREHMKAVGDKTFKEAVKAFLSEQD